MKKVMSVLLSFCAVCLFAGNLMADCSYNACNNVLVEEIDYSYESESIFITTSGTEKGKVKDSCLVNINNTFYLRLNANHPNHKNVHAGILAAKMSGKKVGLWLDTNTCNINRVIVR